MPNYVIQRASGYYLRYVIPRRFQHLLHARELRYTLHTPSRRTAAKRARAVVGRIDFLLDRLARGCVTLDDKTIRDTIRAYVEEARSRISDSHLTNPPRNSDESEAHMGLLLDGLHGLQSSLSSSNFSGKANTKARYEGTTFSGDIEDRVCELFQLDPEAIDRGDLQFKKACREWAIATAELWEDHLKRLSGEPTLNDTPYLIATPSAQPTAGTQEPIGPLLSKAVADFLSERKKTKGIAETTASGYEQFVQTFIDLMGDDPVNQVTPTLAADFRDRLLIYPANKAKKKAYRDRSATELLSMEIPESDRISAATVNNYLVHLSTVFDWLEKRQVVEHNPFQGLALKADAEAWKQFEAEDLEGIFTSPLYRPGSVYFKRSTTTAAHWWLVLLGIFTGARAGELLQMRLDDLKDEGGVLVAAIVEDKETGQRLKTKAAARRVPIHPRLRELGFSEYVQQLQVAGASRVLEGIKLDKRKAGATAGKWFARYKDSHLPSLRGGRKVLHSTRSTFYTAALHGAGIPEGLLKQLVGHSQEAALGAGVSYNKGAGVLRLYEEITKVGFKCDALNALGQDWRHLELFNSNQRE